MNLPKATHFTFAGILGAAAVAFILQRQKLHGLRAEHGTAKINGIRSSQVLLPATVAHPNAKAAARARGNQSASSDKTKDFDAVDRLLERVNASLDQQRGEIEAAGDQGAAATESERMATLLDLDEREAAACRHLFEEHFAQSREWRSRPGIENQAREQALAAFEHGVHDFVAANFGEERAARYRTAQEARRKAAIEHNATQALQAVAKVVDLNDEQKDALHGAFMEKARAIESLDSPMGLQTQLGFEFHDEPRIENAVEIARGVLTPEQLALYETQLKNESRQQQQLTKSAMKVMARVFSEVAGNGK